MIKSQLTKHQVIKFEKENVILDGNKYKRVVMNIRYDDSCNNGHNSFGVTGEFYSHRRDPEMGGCCHDELEKVFPEYSHLIKWHFMTSKGVAHGVSNAMYHASDTDCWGFKKGEYSRYHLELISSDLIEDEEHTIYKTGTLYTNPRNNENLDKSNKKELTKLEEFKAKLKLTYKQVKIYDECSVSEGKEVDIKAARNCCIWPEASLEQLRDKETIEKHIKSLIPKFKTDIESLGMIF